MKTENMTARLVSTIKNDVIMGRLKPGEKLLPLRELAEAHGVSRSVVNAAISSLSAQGYVRIVPRHHVEVADFLTSGTLGIVGDVIRSENHALKRKLTQDSLSLRMVLTIDAVRTIANSARTSLHPLVRLLEREQQWLAHPVKDYAKFWKFDQAFNETLVSLGDNYAYRLLYRNYRYIADGLIVMFFHNLDLITFLVEKHQQLLSALRDHDEKAAVAIAREMLSAGANEALRFYA